MAKKIKLTQGKFTIVDDENFDILNRVKWRYQSTADNQGGYAIGTIFGIAMPIHRYLMNTPKHLLCDHIDGDKLNNRKQNLRNVTHSQNQMSIRRKNGKWKGVRKCTTTGKFYANLTKNGKTYGSKQVSSRKEAAEEYDKLAKKYFKQYACLNFPDK